MNVRTLPCPSLNTGPNAWGPRRRRAAIGLLGLALATSASAADKIKVGFISTLSGPGR